MKCSEFVKVVSDHSNEACYAFKTTNTHQCKDNTCLHALLVIMGHFGDDFSVYLKGM
jgi:hypothetical protein